jgi:hypothetical protein
MSAMSDEESAPFAEHLLVCQECRDRVAHHDLLLLAVRKAAPAARAAGEPERLWILRPVWITAAAALLFCGVLVVRNGIHPLQPQTVPLEAMRGIGAKAESDRPLRLQPDLKGLASYPTYRLEMVNELGGRVFETGISAAKPEATVPGVPPGVYFVRIYTPAGEVLREYGVDTR